MSEIIEIAHAAASKKLCLFTGTGFSKAVTNNTIPSWQELLELVCDELPNGDDIKLKLFPINEINPLGLEESAQVISIELNAIDKNIHEIVAQIISGVSLKGENTAVKEFFSSKEFIVASTNYDKLAEELSGMSDCQSVAPGLPIPKSFSRVKVYHVHGSVASPNNMIVTTEDYFNFIKSNSYFSKKLSTVLHENTIVILGYSLGDANLKAIMNEYKGFSNNHVTGSNIFLVSRDSVVQHVKDYYSHCYGIRVIDNTEIHDFFVDLNAAIPKVERIVGRAKENIKKVIYNGNSFKKSYLKLEDSFTNIIWSLSAEGLSLDDSVVVETLGKIIDAKRELTLESDAWEQYVHLAKWLIYLGSIFEIKGTLIEARYLAAVLRSMETMSSTMILGCSWHAYGVWKSRWSSITSSNRALIKKHIQDNSSDPDAESIINSI